MSDAFDVGVLTPFSRLGSIVTPIFGIALNSKLVNRTPLYTRTFQAPLGSLSFKTSSSLYRPSSVLLANGGNVLAGDATITVADGSMFQTGDTIECGTEEMLITSISTDTLTVTRGYAGTTAAGHTDTGVVYLLSNTRTGSEVNVSGISYTPTVIVQWAQTFQHPWAIGGSLASTTDFALPPGVVSVVGRERMMAIINQCEDIERAIYYGRVVSIGSATAKPAMAGFRSLITTHNTSSPTNASAYKPPDLTRDLIQPVYDSGGDPEVLVCSTDWMTGFTIWGTPLMRLQAGETKFGTAINEFEAPFLDGVSIVPAPLLRPGTIFCLSRDEYRLRVKRGQFDKPRGSQGDAEMGDVIFEGAIELDNQSHHSWVSGVTGWSAT